MPDAQSTQGEQAQPVMSEITTDIQALIEFGYLAESDVAVILDYQDIA